MKPAPFEYHCPRTVDEGTALLAEYGDDAKVLAGGQSLVPLMNMRLARPANLDGHCQLITSHAWHGKVGDNKIVTALLDLC